jgi:hypothetical protein
VLTVDTDGRAFDAIAREALAGLGRLPATPAWSAGEQARIGSADGR